MVSRSEIQSKATLELERCIAEPADYVRVDVRNGDQIELSTPGRRLGFVAISTIIGEASPLLVSSYFPTGIPTEGAAKMRELMTADVVQRKPAYKTEEGEVAADCVARAVESLHANPTSSDGEVKVIGLLDASMYDDSKVKVTATHPRDFVDLLVANIRDLPAAEFGDDINATGSFMILEALMQSRQLTDKPAASSEFWGQKFANPDDPYAIEKLGLGANFDYSIALTMLRELFLPKKLILPKYIQRLFS